MTKVGAPIFAILLAASVIFIADCRPIPNGEDEIKSNSSVIEEAGSSIPVSTTVTCEATYGFLPCTTVVWGQLFLLAVYEYLLTLSDQYISTGSQLLFQMFGTGTFGACFFRVLPFFPQLMLVVVAVITSSEKSVESSASIGMGIVAGSTILHVTLIWASVVAFGSYDLSRDSLHKKKPLSWTGYGVTADAQTKYTARIMLLGTMVPFLILLTAKFVDSSSGKRVVVLVVLIVSLALLFGYCIYQIFVPWIQSRRLEYLMFMYLRENVLWRLLTAEGLPDEMEIRKLFSHIDSNNHIAGISADALRTLIFGTQMGEFGLEGDHFVAEVMKEFNISGNATISESDFIRGMSNWLNKVNDDKSDREDWILFNRQTKRTGEEYESLLPKKGVNQKNAQKTWWNCIKFSYLIVLGTAIAAVLAKPITSTLKDFSVAINIPSFYISYVIIPVALRFRQALKAITSASQKTSKSSSLTFSEIYSEIFLNSVLGVSSFLLMVYIRNITMDVSAEAMAVLIICTAMGIYASVTTTIPVWTCIPVYILYPISLAIMYVLTNVLGWT